MNPLRRLAPDLRPLRASRDLRLLVIGNVVSGIGTQAALVALPYQVYTQTRSALLTGLLGAAELVPLVTLALLGGALSDRMDRRRLLLLDQFGLVGTAVVLCVLAALGSPPVWSLFVLAGLTAGFGAIQNVVRSAMVPNLVDPAMLPQAIAVNFGLYQLTLVIGPGLGGILIGVLGLAPVYAMDAISCGAVVFAALRMAPQPPQEVAANAGVGIRRSILDGLVFVRGNRALLGSFAIDLVAMTFGMPRALFPVLAISVYHAGAEGTGLLFASVSIGATIAALTTGWIEHTRRLGLVCIGAVITWSLAIGGAGLFTTILPAAILLAVAGAADSISAVCRSVINQSVTPDAMRGRMSSVFSLVVTSGPRLGDIESGTVASLTSARLSMGSGGLACLAGVGLVVLLFPQLAAFDAQRAREGAPAA